MGALLKLKEFKKILKDFLIVFYVLNHLAVFSEASFNLFISVDEVKTLLGLPNPKELYYVREGVINEYALRFVVPIPPKVKGLHFTWQTLGNKPLAYTASFEISDSVAMEKPSLNISTKGVIPTEPQTFRVWFPCTGALSDEAHFELSLSVSSGFRTQNNTNILFKRKRICIKDSELKTRHRGGHPASQDSPLNNKKNPIKGTTNAKNNNFGNFHNLNTSYRSPPANNPENNEKKSKNIKNEEDFGVISASEEAADTNNLLYIFLASTIGLLLIILTLASVSFVYMRRKKISGGGTSAESSGFLHVSDGTGSGCSNSSASGGSGGSILFRSDSPHHYSSVSPTNLDSSDIYSYSTYYDSETQKTPFYMEILNRNNYSTLDKENRANNTKLAEMVTIPRCKVRLQSVILEGTFAKVYNGTVLERDGSEKKVIVKTVSDGCSPVQMALLLHEGLSLVGLVQQHVYRVIGVAAEERVPPFLIYPHDNYRNLKRYLHRCRSGPGRPISTQEVVHMAIQIGSALAFLHRQNLIHRDVATRNCVVDDKLMVKLSDSALSRDLFPDDYCWVNMGEPESRPIKWMSPELILQNIPSSQADIWSFGVVIWELATLAQQPYSELETDEIIPFLKMGYRLSQPMNCPDELYLSMTRCWTWEGDNRPKWTQMLPELQSLHAQLAQYV